jgi:hypothetical protein
MSQGQVSGYRMTGSIIRVSQDVAVRFGAVCRHRTIGVMDGLPVDRADCPLVRIRFPVIG